MIIKKKEKKKKQYLNSNYEKTKYRNDILNTPRGRYNFCRKIVCNRNIIYTQKHLQS